MPRNRREFSWQIALQKCAASFRHDRNLSFRDRLAVPPTDVEMHRGNFRDGAAPSMSPIILQVGKPLKTAAPILPTNLKRLPFRSHELAKLNEQRQKDVRRRKRKT
jgi:hypothetical protein